MNIITEVLYEDDHGEFYWAMCACDGCTFQRTHDSDLYCYRHSRWYRKFLVPFNLLRSAIFK